MAFPSLSLPSFSHLYIYIYLSLGLFIYSPFMYTVAAPAPDIESSGHSTQQQTPIPIQLQDLLLPMTLTPPSSTSTSSDSDSESESESDSSSETDSDPHEQTFTISTVLNDPSPPYAAKIQCWRLLNSVFHTYPTVGKAAFLGAVSNLTYVVLPPHSQEGWHRPPAPMFFVLVSGEAHVSTPKQDLSLSHVPSDPPNTAIDTDLDLNLDLNLDIDIDNDTESATRNLYITSTRNSVILALDTDLRASGHLTFYPGRTETVALQIPLSSSLHLFDTPDGSGKRPLAVSGINYEVVKNGPCE